MLKFRQNPIRKARFSKKLEKAATAALKTFGYLENKYVAFVLIALVLVSAYLAIPSLWKYVFSALLSYFVASMFMRYSLRHSLFRLKRAGKGEVSEGHIFFVFVILIVVATFTSNILADYLSTVSALYPGDKMLIIILQTLITLSLILLDMEFEF